MVKFENVKNQNWSTGSIIDMQCNKSHIVLDKRTIWLFASIRLDIQHITENFQSAVSIMSQNAFCKDLTKLYAFLVEAVQVPYEALEHDLVFKVS